MFNLSEELTKSTKLSMNFERLNIHKNNAKYYYLTKFIGVNYVL